MIHHRIERTLPRKRPRPVYTVKIVRDELTDAEDGGLIHYGTVEVFNRFERALPCPEERGEGIW